MATAASLQRIRVEIAPDRLSASLQFQPQGDESPPTHDEVIAVLKESKLPVNDQVRQQAGEFVRLAGSAEPPREAFVVMEGQPPVEGKDEEFVWAPAFQERAQSWQDDAPVNYYSLNTILTVDKEAVIGTTVPMKPSKDGVDVFGKVVKATTTPQPLLLDDTVRRDVHDSLRIVANVPGRVLFAEQRLSIAEVLLIQGDIDFKTSNVDSSTDVVIAGTVQDKFEVRSEKSISVGGAIEAARVHAEGDIAVRHGILGRNRGRVSAGGEVVAKFSMEADIRAGADVKIVREIMNCRTHAAGRLIVEHGAVIGGCHYAKEGAVIGTLGSDADIPTRIAIGIHPTIFLETAAIEDSVEPTRRTIERIRSTVQPLMANLKRLNPSQREQATELLFKAEEAEGRIAEALERRDRPLEEGRAKTPPSVVVSKVVYPGVTISIGKRLAIIRKEYQGPISIEKRKISNVTEIVAVSQLTGSVLVIPSGRVPLEELVEGLEPDQADEAQSDK